MKARFAAGREFLYALALVPFVVGVVGCGGGGNGIPAVNRPPIATTPNVNPANVDFSGQPPVGISLNVTDSDQDPLTVTATIRRQSDGATFSVTNFVQNGNAFTANFTAPPNSGTTQQRYIVTVSATDGVNPAINVQAGQDIIVSPPEAAPPPPLP